MVSFRTLAIGIGVMGIAMGVAFGAGVAYGRGDPKTIQAGLTQQQIQQLYGAPAGGGAAAAGGAGAAGAGGAPAGASGTGGGAQGGAAAAAAARSTTGRVTAVSGQTVTIETSRGAQKVNLTGTTAVSKITGGTAADITEGTTIYASGTRKDDGSFDATAVSQVPADLAQLLGTTIGGGATGASGSTGPR